jgi:hypothetical protein
MVYGLLLFGLVLSYTGAAQAIPSADFRYTETSLGSGVWHYDYTLYNSSDPITDAGFDIYDVFLSLDPARILTASALPAGWDSFGGTGGFFEAFSLAPPVGADIAPGASLSDFSFDMDYRAGKLPFEVLFVNPGDLGNPMSLSGTTSPETTPVPEPSTIILLGLGMGVILLNRRNKNRS